MMRHLFVNSFTEWQKSSESAISQRIRIQGLWVRADRGEGDRSARLAGLTAVARCLAAEQPGQGGMDLFR